MHPFTDNEPAWWRQAVTYQIYIRSFSDTDADGIGDLGGVRSRLSYLSELGVDAIWLNPFYPSPQSDHGYDVADYTDVDPAYGSLADLAALVADAHALGMKVLVDIVPNHCSTTHPYFAAALAAGPASPERARFHFANGRGDQPPNNWRSMFGGPAWTRVPDGQWYLHLFTPNQPDWNWRHPEVPAMFEEILRFWLDRGVDGFRIDAAQGLFKHPDLPDAVDPFEEERVADAANALAWNQPEVLDIYASWRTIADRYASCSGTDRVLIGEVTGIGQRHLADYIGPERLHQAFFFGLLGAPFDAHQLRQRIVEGLETADATGSSAAWALGNHDTVRVVTRYAGGSPGHGSGDVERGTARARAAILLLLSLPGAAYLYQGEELGLPEFVDLPDERITDPIYVRTEGVRRGRDGCRVPLPWYGRVAPFGFSHVADTWLPQPEYFEQFTVEREVADLDSTWHLYRAALQVRHEQLKADPPLRWLQQAPGVLAFARGDGFVFALNTTDDALPAPCPGEPVLASGTVGSGKLPGNTAAWWIV